MLIDDDARDLLPYWAGFVSGVVESDELTPTASREDLQRDNRYRRTRELLTEALIGGLSRVARGEPEAWRRVLLRHNEALLGASLCDDRLFALLADDLKIPTSQGDLTIPTMRRASKGRLHVALGSNGGFEEMLFRALHIPIARGDRFAVLSVLRRYADEHGLSVIEVGTRHGDGSLFGRAHLDAGAVDWLSESLAEDGEELVPASFDPPELPLVVVPDREVELKERIEADEADRRMATAALRLARTYTESVDGSVRARVYLNVRCPAVTSLLEAPDRDAKGVVQAVNLLRAVKQLLAANALERSEHEDSSLSEALAGIGAALKFLVCTEDELFGAGRPECQGERERTAGER